MFLTKLGISPITSILSTRLFNGPSTTAQILFSSATFLYSSSSSSSFSSSFFILSL
ncbi:hypothetical protein AWRI1631_45610 [Saccharomyces cerevisiae AWRI1631]|uniref:Uncharacterized protein n=1 Tax=Saccharomyces cerevisiae (strain AWRI1631) TaxID=545124 RepID=B5VGM6_YEAS6|nr:hypothetical protein AWRI1631_45610 [Saccharomyces cerevisiae AWRI1631]